MRKDFYEQYFKHGRLISCFPVSSKNIAFILKDSMTEEEMEKHIEETGEPIEPDELPTKLIVYLEKNMPFKYGVATWATGVEEAHPQWDNEDGWIVSTNDLHAYEMLVRHPEKPPRRIQWYEMPNREYAHLCKGTANIDGRVYAYGMVRSVFKRTGVQQWENITTIKNHPNLHDDLKDAMGRSVGDRVGFSAMDGFNGEDIYAGGNGGDCWHYDGKQWRRKDLPLNSDISSIVCTPEGQVYIACRVGPVIVGRDDTWKTLAEVDQIRSAAYFNGVMYFVSVLGWLKSHKAGEDQLSEAAIEKDLPKYMQRNLRGIASCSECLVAYTDIQAYAYDGKEWREIIEIPSLSSYT